MDRTRVSGRKNGQHARPHEIEAAPRKEYCADQALAGKQRLAVTHVALLHFYFPAFWPEAEADALER